MNGSYPYYFIKNIRNDTDSCSNCTKLFRFKSEKSNRIFIVRVEIYPHNVYVIKFYDKNHRHSPKKYNQLTNDREPRRIIMTCISILKTFYEEDHKSSFAFIGTNCEDESMRNNKRFRVYKTIVTTQFGENTFAHFTNEENSAYLLLRQSELESNENLLNDIQERFSSVYHFSL